MRNLLLVSLVLLLQACAAGDRLVAKVEQFRDMEADIIVPNLDEPYVTDIEGALQVHRVDGATVVTIENGVVGARGHYGLADKFNGVETSEDTLYQAASLSKMIAGLAMAKAHRTTGPLLGRRVSRHASSHPGGVVQWWKLRAFDNAGKSARAEKISVRRLLQNTAGLNTPTTGTSCHSGDTSIMGILGAPGSLSCASCVSTIKAKPGEKWKYSSGGFVVAEAMFVEVTGRDPADFLRDEILRPYKLYDSTFADGSIAINDLARGCDAVNAAGLCDCAVEKAEVKFPGGLLAKPTEYAALLALLVNQGLDSEGDVVIPAEDLHELMTPAHHVNSSLNSCTTSTACANDELCILDRCVDPLETGHAGLGWYGLGVHMSKTVLDDGYPRTLSHTGGQDGFSSYFSIDRLTGDGVVIFINGPGGGKILGRKPLLNAIVDSYRRHY